MCVYISIVCVSHFLLDTVSILLYLHSPYTTQFPDSQPQTIPSYFSHSHYNYVHTIISSTLITYSKIILVTSFVSFSPQLILSEYHSPPLSASPDVSQLSFVQLVVTLIAHFSNASAQNKLYLLPTSAMLVHGINCTYCTLQQCLCTE